MNQEQEPITLPETRQPAEAMLQEAEKSLTEQAVTSLYARRQQEAEMLKPYLSLKFFYRVMEKIRAEQEQLEQLLNYEKRKHETLSQYSFVLDPHYFEQKFLTNP